MHRESRGFAFITFAHASYAASAMVNMNGAMLYGPFREMALRVAPSARDLHAQVPPPFDSSSNLQSRCVSSLAKI